MIPNTKLRVISSHGVASSGEFGISANDSAHIMTMLRDTLYSDKELAVLREYSSNAWDAHREVGKSILPIKVTMPTDMDPTLYIRDFGPGLSKEDVFQVYTQYGASTKRDTDNQVGSFGIGSKSGFAYSDSFTITSFHGGMKRTYVAVLDPSNKGLMNMLHEEPCGDETGILFQIAIRPRDIPTFQHKAKELYKYFQPRPDINLEIPPLPAAQMTLKNGVLYEESEDIRKWVAVMGCVSYRVNLDQLKDMDKEPEGGVANFLSEISGALYFDIGDVQVSGSREELKYNSHTNAKLVEKFNALVDEYVQQTLHGIENGGFNLWERKIRGQVLRKLRLPVPKSAKGLIESSVDLEKDKIPKSLAFVRGKHAATSIEVADRTRLLIRDDRRALSGFGLSGNDYFVRRTEGKVSWEQVRKDLDALCEELGIVGIPIFRTSQMDWSLTRRVTVGRMPNEKHRLRLFKLRESGYHSPWSGAWEAIKHAPKADDVFVIIHAFKPIRQSNFFSEHKTNLGIAEALGVPMPDVYGYKYTDSKPIEEKDCVGIPYLKWQESFYKALVGRQDVKDLLEKWVWRDLLNEYRHQKQYYYRGDRDGPLENHYEKLGALIGPNHPITLLLKNVYEAKLFFKKKKKPELEEALSELFDEVKSTLQTFEADKKLDEIRKKYPLFDEDSSFHCLTGAKSEAWIQYVNLIDNAP